MSTATLALSALPPAAVRAAKRMPEDVRGDFISELWIALTELKHDDSIARAVKIARDRVRRQMHSCGAVHPDDDDTGDGIEEAVSAGMRRLRDARPGKRYKHYVDDMVRDGETRRNGQIKLRKNIEHFQQGDLFLGLPLADADEEGGAV